jgi:hypothetical protein
MNPKSSQTLVLGVGLLLSNLSCASVHRVAEGGEPRAAVAQPSARQGETQNTANTKQNAIFEPYLKTVTLHPADAPLSPPYVSLGSEGSLELRFDDLNGGYQNYAFRLTHCDPWWEPSELLPSEYIQGFHEISITEIEQSFNSMQPYTHYLGFWPNNFSAPIISGNFLLTVYDEDEPERPLIQRRLVVFEQLIRFQSDIKASSIVAERRFKQEVDFTIVAGAYTIFDPKRELEVAILQNDRWDNAITGLKPVFMRGQELIYDFNAENNFDGLNEYRWVDLKSVRFAAMGTDSIRDLRDGWHYYLTPARRRTYEAYRTDQDINGRFLIRNDDFDSHTEAEYIHVHFYVPITTELPGAALHVVGDFTDYRLTPDTRLKWNAKRKWYETTLLMKQGYYNFMYTVVTPDRLKGDITVIEGNHQVAENNYTIFAYHYQPQGFYRVIGVLATDSFNR